MTDMLEGKVIVTKPYRREKAVAYARKWALGRNPLFTDFTEIGGDCTNFVSQCLYAGGCVMDIGGDTSWYYINADERAPAWTGVDFLFRYLTGRDGYPEIDQRRGPFAFVVNRSGVIPGDVVQISDEDGVFYHSLLVSEVEGGEIYVCAHTLDSLDRPLSSYSNVGERFLHIEGIKVAVNDTPCFSMLMQGGED